MASKTQKRSRKQARVPPAPSRRTPQTHARRPAVVPTPQAQAPRARRLGSMAPRQIYAVAIGLALVIAALLIGLSQLSAHRGASQPAPTAAVPGAGATAALLNGIPQHGNVLGSPHAPIRLIEYADPQCPYCAEYTLNVMPTLIRDYVRPGKVQLEFRGLWFLGQDSGTALATATAAGLQNRFWNVIDLLYRNQRTENTGWVTDSLLRSIVTAAGANADQVFADRTSSGVNSTIRTWSTQAANAGVNSVPTFYYGARGGPLRPLTLSAIAVPEFRAALDRAVNG